MNPQSDKELQRSRLGTINRKVTEGWWLKPVFSAVYIYFMPFGNTVPILVSLKI